MCCLKLKNLPVLDGVVVPITLLDLNELRDLFWGRLGQK